MICSIHQPNYIPYIGLFHKINKSDLFIFYDNVQYAKGDYHNRNKIKGPNGEILLTIPVSVSLGMKINEVKFNNKILQKHLKTIKQSYKKSSHYDELIGIIEEIFSFETDNLSKFNINFIKKVSKYIGIKTKFKTLSELNFNLKNSGTDALVDICLFLGVSDYISGSGGKNYIDETKFNNNGINLHYQNFDHPKYEQLWGDFLPYMSVIDLLFNEGKNSINYIK